MEIISGAFQLSILNHEEKGYKRSGGRVRHPPYRSARYGNETFDRRVKDSGYRGLRGRIVVRYGLHNDTVSPVPSVINRIDGGGKGGSNLGERASTKLEVDNPNY